MLTNNKNYQVDFNIRFDTLTVDYSSTFNFKFLIKKGTSSIETKNTMKYETGGRKEVNLNESVLFTSELKEGKERNDLQQFEDCIAKIYLQVYTKQGFKNATYCEINLAKFSKFDQSGKNNTVELDFVKHPFGFLKLKVSVVPTTNLDSVSPNLNQEDTRKNTLNVENATPIITNSPNNVSMISTFGLNADKKQDNDEDVFLLNEQIKILNQRIETLEKDKAGLESIIMKSINETVENTFSSKNGNLNSSRISEKSAHNEKRDKNETSDTKRLYEELKDKESIISDLKNENEYFTDENTQLKAIINELKTEKNKQYEEKTSIIKSQKEEIDNFKIRIAKLESDEVYRKKDSEFLKLQTEQNNSIIDEYKKKISEIELQIKQEKKLTEDLQISQKEELKKLENQHENEISECLTNHKINIQNKVDQIESLEAKISQLGETQTKLIYEKEEKDQLIDSLNNKIQTLNTQIQSIEDENLTLKQTQSSTISEINEDISAKKKEIESKDQIIKENREEIAQLTLKIQDMEEKAKYIDLEKESSKDRFVISEKKLKSDIVNLRDILSKKDEEVQIIANERENLKFENEKLKAEMKSLAQSKSNDDYFIQQINEMQLKFSEKEIKIAEEKNSLINSLKKEIETLNSQIKKNANHNDKDLKLLQSENQKMKEEITFFIQEAELYKDLKDKVIRMEKNYNELQNNYAIKKIELTQSQMECEKVSAEFKKIMNTFSTVDSEQKETISNLEQELISTKQKLGETLNEIGDYENKITSFRGDEHKKNRLFSFFSKKKKENKQNNSDNNIVNK